MQHIAIDIETLDTRVGSVILSIGAVPFGENGQVYEGDLFYAEVNRQSCKARGMTESADTITWWNEQPADARALLERVECESTPSLEFVLGRFAGWMFARTRGGPAVVWGNGANFDNAHLEDAYARIGQPTPWSFWETGCMRTLRLLTPDSVKRSAPTIPHHAGHDAIAQADYISRALRALGEMRDNAEAYATMQHPTGASHA